MPDQRTIYVATCGEYSDYTVLGVFESEELAAIALGPTGYSLELFVLNSAERVRGEFYAVTSSGLEQVDVAKIERVSGDQYIVMTPDHEKVVRYMDRMVTLVEADTEAQAIKIAADRFRACKAFHDLQRPPKILP